MYRGIICQVLDVPWPRSFEFSFSRWFVWKKREGLPEVQYIAKPCKCRRAPWIFFRELEKERAECSKSTEASSTASAAEQRGWHIAWNVWPQLCVRLSGSSRFRRLRSFESLVQWWVTIYKGPVYQLEFTHRKKNRRFRVKASLRKRCRDKVLTIPYWNTQVLFRCFSSSQSIRP